MGLPQLVWAAITKIIDLVASTTDISHSLEAGSPKIEVFAYSVSGEGLLPDT